MNRGPHAAFVVIPVVDPDTTDDEFALNVATIVNAVYPFEARVVDHPAAVDFLAHHIAATKRRATQNVTIERDGDVTAGTDDHNRRIT